MKTIAYLNDKIMSEARLWDSI